MVSRCKKCGLNMIFIESVLFRRPDEVEFEAVCVACGYTQPVDVAGRVTQSVPVLR